MLVEIFAFTIVVSMLFLIAVCVNTYQMLQASLKRESQIVNAPTPFVRDEMLNKNLDAIGQTQESNDTIGLFKPGSWT